MPFSHSSVSHNQEAGGRIYRYQAQISQVPASPARHIPLHPGISSLPLLQTHRQKILQMTSVLQMNFSALYRLHRSSSDMPSSSGVSSHQSYQMHLQGSMLLPSSYWSPSVSYEPESPSCLYTVHLPPVLLQSGLLLHFRHSWSLTYHIVSHPWLLRSRCSLHWYPAAGSGFPSGGRTEYNPPPWNCYPLLMTSAPP